MDVLYIFYTVIFSDTIVASHMNVRSSCSLVEQKLARLLGVRTSQVHWFELSNPGHLGTCQ